MGAIRDRIKPAVLAAAIAAGAPAAAQDGDRLDDLYAALKAAEGDAALQIEEKIREEWSRSGSPAMDLLLERGREAMQAEDLDRATEHFSALIDHAPGFAEGYHARATAHFAQDRYGPALDDLRRTLALNPRHFDAMMGLGLILEDIGETEGALTAFRAAQALHPSAANMDVAIRNLQLQVEGERL